MHKGSSSGFSLKFPLVKKTITQRKTGSNSLYPSSYKPHYLSPTCSTTKCQKNYLERPLRLETRIKKQEEKRKLTRKNWKVNLLILEMGTWKTFPPCRGRGGGVRQLLSSPLPAPKKISGIGVLLSKM